MKINEHFVNNTVQLNVNKFIPLIRNCIKNSCCHPNIRTPRTGSSGSTDEFLTKYKWLGQISFSSFFFSRAPKMPCSAALFFSSVSGSHHTIHFPLIGRVGKRVDFRIYLKWRENIPPEDLSIKSLSHTKIKQMSLNYFIFITSHSSRPPA